jgi:hypothetical protein
MLATIPRLTTSPAISSELKRESGTPLVLARSHASDFTSTFTSGGKNRRASSPWPVLESVKAFLKEALSPFRNDLAR